MRPHRIGGRLEVSRLGFGAASIGNLYRAVDDATAADAVAAAWDGGVRYFDTAPHYGLGLSERRLGAALASRPRDGYVVSTKVGRLLEPDPGGADRLDDAGFVVPAAYRRRWDFSRDGVLRSVESSLVRLGLDRVDMVFLHDPDDHWRPAFEQGYPALAELRDQGVVRAIGAGMNQSEMLADFVRETDLDVVMLAGRYTLLEQGALDELLPLCLERGTRVLAAAVFNSGLLAADRPAPDARYNYRAAPPELLDRVVRIATVCERHGVTLPQAALAFPLGHPAVASVVVGMGSARHATLAARRLAAGVPAALWPDLVAEGLLRPDAPVPSVPGSGSGPPVPGPSGTGSAASGAPSAGPASPVDGVP